MSFMLAKSSQLARDPGDPQVLESGPSSLTAAKRTGRVLGWFSLGLGAVELLAPRAVTRWLGMEGREGLIRAYGAREVASGVLCLSANNDYGAFSRVGGDVLDLATLAAAYRDDNPRKANVGIAIAAVAAITIADAVTGLTIREDHRRKGPVRDFSDRSGFPKGVEASRGAAADFQRPEDTKAAPPTANASVPPADPAATAGHRERAEPAV